MKAGDLVKWTFAKTSPFTNVENKYELGMLLYPEICPEGSWSILLFSGHMIHADESEIEALYESK